MTQEQKTGAAFVAMKAALELSQRMVPWVHNAAITNDIEALRAIALAYSEWNNTICLPALAVADDAQP